MYDTLAIIDCDATTADPGGAVVTEVAVVVCRNGAIVSRAVASVGTTDGATVDAVLAGQFRELPSDFTCLVHDADRVGGSVPAAGGEFGTQPLLDSRELARLCFPGLDSYDLDSLAETLGLFGERLDPRRTVARCELTFRLWERILQTALDLSPPILDAVLRLMGTRRDDPLRDFFRTVAGSHGKPGRRRGRANLGELFAEERLPPMRREITAPSAYVPLEVDEVAGVLGRDGPFATRLQGYEYREEQMQMTRAVAEAFNGSRHLLVEAGTGVGKSLAYLVPAVLWATTNRTPVVISTNTKNLQAQLFAKDIPLVRSMLEQPFTAALIKGRLNYLCLRRLNVLLGHGGSELDPAQRRALAGVVVWAGTTRTGDLSEVLNGPEASSAGLGPELTSTGEECRGPSCSERRQCFLYRARRKAMGADVIVANHAVVLKEMGADEGSPVLPPYAHLIFDEAHNLEAAATSLLSREVSRPRLRIILHRLARAGRRRQPGGVVPVLLQQVETGQPKLGAEQARKVQELGDAVLAALPPIEPASETFFDRLAAVLKSGGRKETVRLDTDRKTEIWWTGLDEARAVLALVLERLRKGVVDLAVAVAGLPPDTFPEGADIVPDLNAAACWLLEFVGDLDGVFGTGGEDGVAWVERVSAAQGGVRAWSAPIHVGPGLAEGLYKQKQSVIFVSATLTAGTSFGFMRKRLGVDCLEADRVGELVLGTPFDYARQCRLLVPMFLPEPGANDDAYSAELGRLLADVFRCTQGRGLVLFTSFEMLRKTASILRRDLDDTGIRVLEQGVSGSREGITDVFRRDIQSVLLGAQSFWEGVDVVGESLSCLVVARLPFAVFTDPVVAARCEHIEAEGGNAFKDYSLPSAVIRFRQGFGRLIRHRTDRGIVIVTDRRLVAKPYGRWFRQSLPVPTISVHDREEFLAGIRAFLQDEG